jgi:hypothetical protein
VSAADARFDDDEYVASEHAGLVGPGGAIDRDALFALYEQQAGEDEAPITVTFRLLRDLDKRLDRYLVDRVPFLSRTQIQRLIEESAVTVNGRGTGPRGVAYSNTGMYTATWDGSCLGLSGAVTTAGGGASGTLTFASFRRCRGVCPDSGGRITLAGSGGRTVTLAYNGSATATATVSGSTTRTYSIPLYCAAQ